MIIIVEDLVQLNLGSEHKVWPTALVHPTFLPQQIRSTAILKSPNLRQSRVKVNNKVKLERAKNYGSAVQKEIPYQKSI